MIQHQVPSDLKAGPSTACPERLMSSLTEGNIKSVVNYLHIHSHANPEMEDALNKVLKMLQSEEKLLRAALFGEPIVPRVKPVGQFAHEEKHKPMDAELESKLEKLANPENATSWIHSADKNPQVDAFDLTNPYTHAEKRACSRNKISRIKAEPSSSDIISRLCSVDGSIPCVLLCFNRHPRQFQEALLHSELAAEFEARGVDVSPEWAHGAKIFLDNVTEEAVEQVGIKSDELRPWHVLAHEENEPRIHSALRGLKCRPRPRVRSMKSLRLTLIGDPQVKVDSV